MTTVGLLIVAGSCVAGWIAGTVIGAWFTERHFARKRQRQHTWFIRPLDEWPNYNERERATFPWKHS